MPSDGATAADQRLGSPSPPSDGLPEPDGELLTGGAGTGLGEEVFVGVAALRCVVGARCVVAAAAAAAAAG